ncbi:MAG TPA: NAD(P)/FAD-dependent oxidoreductase [Candidatus Avacidaminococcus intestinavium]|uniref:NAD(P)/FAD-dependent oxidoreductase n=1 Tax=Candidatus Avacidaminococcus intestinavium TaxID=2840684 RepID=A0A9D1MRP8_9FIRM|nr:NAD(P)/FAD-dependent oxidoreductase [Candidatus Avacidaminococcus intestinavium]
MGYLRESDVVVIGGGIIGTAILRELSKYDLKSVLVEKEPDLATGTTKANSAILHAGFDAPAGSLKAITNVRGNALYHILENQLDLDIKWTGSLVVATDEEELATLTELLERGQKNGVKDLAILSPEEVLKKEPNLTQKVTGALWAPSAGICWPFQAAVAFAQCAVQNGAEVLTNCRVEKITVSDGRVQEVVTNQGVIKTKYIINAAGVYADEIAKLAGDSSFTINPRKGEYILFDKTATATMVEGVVFPTPSKKGKGVLVCTTTHGNTFIGPSAEDIEEKDDAGVTVNGMEKIITLARKLVPSIPLGAAITEFSGLRAVSDTGDFIIREAQVKGLIHAAGMQSPGLTAAPAVAEEVVEIIRNSDLRTVLKANFKSVLPRKIIFERLSRQKQAELIAQDKKYGRVICRCETVTEAEIVNAIQESCGARTVDGVKRRTRAGMGRCQGGFCGPRVTQILARELDIPITEVLKERKDSHLFYEKFSGKEGEL